MLRKTASLLVLSAAAISAMGCAPQQWSLASTPSLAAPPHNPQLNDMASLIYLAAQTLAERGESLTKDRPIIVTTIASVDDLNSSSTFGRLASELVANRIEQRGYLVRDVRYMHALELEQKTGEFVLSREATKVSERLNAQAVVAGTYAVGGEKIYLTLRLLSADNGELLSSADAVIPLNENTRPLVDPMMKQLETFDQYEAQTSAANGG